MLTKNEINMARELTEKLRNQGDLIAKVLCNMTGREWFESVEFLPAPDGVRGIAITIHNDVFGMVRTRVEWFPEEYLSKSEAELVNELYRRREEEKRRKEAEELAEKEAKEREEEEARKKRYQMFLELSAEFGDTIRSANPIRNCDVGTAEEQQNRFREFCRRYESKGECGIGRSKAACPAFHGCRNPDCSLWWAQMPYTEGEKDESK